MKTLHSLMLLAGLSCLSIGELSAQTTGTPSFSSPLRPFVRSELGGYVSFPEPSGTGWEAGYRRASGSMDVGLRGGLFDPAGVGPSSVLAGFDVRSRIVRHSEDFPLDGAMVFGAGGRFREGAHRFNVPLGLSLGRRIGEASSVSLTQYVQPTAFIRGGSGLDTDLMFALGLGADLRLNHSLDLRLGIGVGDLEGISLGATWVH